MGARPSSFRKSGGFLNGVDGVITGYTFTDEFGGVPWKPGRNPVTKKEKFHSLYCVLSARVDGAEEDVTTTLFVGGADDWEVSEDGHTLTSVEDGQVLGAGTGFSKFLASLCEAGFPETLLPEDENNFEPIIGTRVRFVQRVDEETTKKLGKRKSKDGKKEYARTDLVVDNVYDLPSAKGASKAVTKGKSKTAVQEEAEETDIAAIAEETLTDILNENSGTIVLAKVKMKVLSKLVKHSDRDAILAHILDTDNADSYGAIAYDAKKKTFELSE